MSENMSGTLRPVMRAQSIWENYRVPCNEYIPVYIVFSEPWRDLHRHVIFLSPHYGLLSAFLYGAVSKRNPMRATAQAFSFGRLNVRQSKRRGQWLQIVDWQLEAPGMVLNPPSCPEVYLHVALWSELLLYSHGTGHSGYSGDSTKPISEQDGSESALLFAELRSLLSSVLHFGSAAHCRLATLRFFWQFLLLEGFQPGLSCCHNCDRAFSLFDEEVFFSERSELLCSRCAYARSGCFLSSEELNLLCWAEQDLSGFVRQDEFFFGQQCAHYSEVGRMMFTKLHRSLEVLLGRSLRSSEFV
ncbi:hypothetical protein P0082_02565 [Candidatus Haliotispira prima]|uniref:Recombination protein O n=1 Tax=Candidatus Haliotispira prima TaxID=3034016 RepID=A0ABY8MK72_9SPIO|nr:hypothetical protein P0082_02565 [Candidatus Haliotispira prima]